MKHLFILVALTLSFTSNAKDRKHNWPVNAGTGKVTFEKTIDTKLSTEQTLTKAKEFSTLHSDAFFATQGVDSRKWALGRIKWGWSALEPFHQPGYIATTNEYVHARMYFGYEAGHSSIFRFTGFWADVFLLARDNQTKIKITNIKYASYKISSPPKRIRLHGGFPHSGPIELWVNKTKYFDAFENAFAFLQKGANYLMSEYGKFMIGGTSEATKWD